MNYLIDSGAGDESNPSTSLLDYVGELIERYENKHFNLNKEIEKVDACSMLKYLMGQHELKQKDLKPIFGSQGIVSEILNGKRQLTLKQIQKLSDFFNVSVQVFI